MFTSNFWRDTAERVIGTFAEALIGSLTVVSVGGGGLTDVSWVLSLSFSGLTALISLLKCVVAATVGNKESASLVK